MFAGVSVLHSPCTWIHKNLYLVFCVTPHPQPTNSWKVEGWSDSRRNWSIISYDWSPHKYVSTCITAFLHQFPIPAKQRRSHFDAWASRQVTLTPSMVLVSLVSPNCHIWDWQVLSDSIIKSLWSHTQTIFMKDLQLSKFQFDKPRASLVMKGIQHPQKPLAERDAFNVAAAAPSMQLRSLSQSGSSEPPQKGSQGCSPWNRRWRPKKETILCCGGGRGLESQMSRPLNTKNLDLQ